jgi:foldase protein PrsA
LFRVRFLFLLLLLPLVLAACGGGGSSSSGTTTGSVAGASGAKANGVPADAAAVIGSVTIPKSRIALYMQQARINFASQNVTFPAVGSNSWRALRGRAVAFLTVGAVYQAKAAAEGITATDAEVKTATEQARKTYGKTKAAQDKAMKKQGMTDAELRTEAKLRVLEQKVQRRQYENVKVTAAEARRYYDDHKSDYSTPATRLIRQILVPTQARAAQLADQARSNGNFATLAKKYSTDRPTGLAGGKVDIRKGLTQPDFDRIAFSLPTGKVSDPIKTQYGWEILTPIAAVKAGTSVPYSQVGSLIRQHLLAVERQNVLSTWQLAARNEYCKGKVKFSPGYAPVPDDNPCNRQATQQLPPGVG